MGPPSEFEELYRDFQRYVWGIVVRKRVPEADQADLVQTIWLAIHRDLPTRNRSNPPKPWVGTIARRAVRDWKGQARHRHEVQMTEGTQEPADPAPGPDADTEAREERRMLEDCIECLDPASAELVSMRYLDEIPVADLAIHHGLKVRVIESRLKRATEELRRVAVRRCGVSRRAQAVLAIVPFDAAIFLAPARVLPELPPGMADRIWRGVQNQIRLDALRGPGGMQVPDGPPAASPTAGAAAARAAAHAATHGVVHAIGGAVAGALAMLLLLRPSAPAGVPSPLIGVLVVDSAAPPSSSAGALPTAAAPAGAASGAPVPAMEAGSSAPAPEGGDAALTADELLLRQARHALVKGDTGAAVVALRLHERRHPHGTAVEVDWNHVRASIAARRAQADR